MQNDNQNQFIPAAVTEYSMDFYLNVLNQKNELLNQCQQTITHLNDEKSKLEISLEQAQKKVQWFEEQFKQMRNRQFGKKSEKISSLQQELIFNVEEDAAKKEENATVESDADTASDNSGNTETITYTRQKPQKTKAGRNIDTSKLPRICEIHDLPEEQKNCGTCGGALNKIREDKSETLEIIPRQVYVVEHIHPQYACSHCVTVTSATKPKSPIPKSMAGASLITDVVLSKYDHHLPLYRQSKIFESMNLKLADNTLGNWVMQAGAGLLPLDAALQQEIIAGHYLQVDETPVKVLEPEKKAYMWVFLSPLRDKKLVRFEFNMSRSGSVVEEALRDYQGILQNDGYSGYNGLRHDENIIPLGCMSHSRRKFVDVAKIGSHKSLGKSHEALAYFAKLYDIEAKARENKLDYVTRKHLRQTKAIPILHEFKSWLDRTKKQVPPESAIGKAIEYTIKQWPYLIAYVDYGEAEIDNNLVENQIRPFALGKKNWLFIMHEESAKISALYYSLIQSAKMNDLNPRVYLHYLHTQIHALRKKTIKPVDLLPHRIDRELLNQFAEIEFKKSQAILPHDDQ